MSKKSRIKGATYEREVADALFLMTGISFKRNLEQSREAVLGDLVADDPDWPFLLECKRYASGTTCRPEWQAQAVAAAEKSGLIPCVVYRFDNRKTRCAMPFAVFGRDCTEWFECSLEGLAYLARELMAAAAEIRGQE